jgi:universal stress protein A
MQIKRILCPIDFSVFNQDANSYASLLANATGAKIIYLHCVTTGLPYVGFCDLDVDNDESEEAKLLKEVRPMSDNIKCSYIICRGQPADAILDYSKNQSIDLIVMGTHGRTGMRRVLLGSVADAVVRRASCPVLALKQPAEFSPAQPDKETAE